MIEVAYFTLSFKAANNNLALIPTSLSKQAFLNSATSTRLKLLSNLSSFSFLTSHFTYREFRFGARTHSIWSNASIGMG